MTQAQVPHLTSARLWGRRTAAVASAFAAAPLAITGMWRLGLPTWAVALLCALVVPALLLAVPRPESRWLAVGWLAGCVADAAFTLWLFSVVGEGLADFGS